MHKLAKFKPINLNEIRKMFYPTVVAFDRTLFKSFTLVLLFFMIIRHSMFYLNTGFINTEMGFNQSFFGVLLLPVTSSFGCLFFWERASFSLSRRDIIRLFIIASIPIILCYIETGSVMSLLQYTIYDYKQRPSFLILMPIALAILVGSYLQLFWQRLMLALLILYFFGNIFLAYYLSIFIIFSAFQSIKLAREIQSSFLSLFIYIVCIFLVYYFQIVRVEFMLELAMTFGYLGAIFFLLRLLPRVNKIIANFKIVEHVSIFYFYLSQAVIFILIQKFFNSPLNFLITPFIFIMSLNFSSFILKYEKKLLHSHLR